MFFLVQVSCPRLMQRGVSAPHLKASASKSSSPDRKAPKRTFILPTAHVWMVG